MHSSGSMLRSKHGISEENAKTLSKWLKRILVLGGGKEARPWDKPSVFPMGGARLLLAHAAGAKEVGSEGEESNILIPEELLLGGPKQAVSLAKCNVFGDSFRNFDTCDRLQEVTKTYYLMHSRQTVDFVQQQRAKWLQFKKGSFTIMEVITMLDQLVDESDPDVDVPNSIHDFQTAERIREQWPEHDWFHLVGLLHDLGKVLALPEFAGEDVLPQWAVVGDTFPVGCRAADAVVFSEFFKENPDYQHEVYGTENGMYQPGCGLGNLLMSWGHDEYMYQMLKANGCTIPEHGLDMIRFHSFYPWHEKRAYTHFEAAEDAETLKWVKEFNRFDLYSKGDALPDVEALKPYYASLISKYGLDGKLRW